MNMTFDLETQIGNAGGFGKVYRCKNENKQTFACKMLVDKSEDGIKRFEREVRLLSRLNHPNVIKLITYNIYEDDKFYIMPIYNYTLTNFIPMIVNNSYAQYRVIDSILNAVSYLHSEGVIHRDLKPDNILCNSVDDIVVTDFGLGIQYDSNSVTLTKTTNLGTWRYCSPEQWTNMHLADERTDIYAIGFIIEDIVTNFGQRPVSDSTMKYVIDKCTKKDKNDRFTSIEDIKRILDNYYSILFGLQTYGSLDEMMMKLEKDELDGRGIIDIANRISEYADKEKTEAFFACIPEKSYQFMELDSLVLTRDLIMALCNYWNQAGWPFSYIDKVANIGERIFMMSQDAEIKAMVLYQVMDLAIYYNRWYAMGTVRRLVDTLYNDITTLSDLALRLKKQRLDINHIFESELELPPLLREYY